MQADLDTMAQQKLAAAESTNSALLQRIARLEHEAHEAKEAKQKVLEAQEALKAKQKELEAQEALKAKQQELEAQEALKAKQQELEAQEALKAKQKELEAKEAKEAQQKNAENLAKEHEKAALQKQQPTPTTQNDGQKSQLQTLLEKTLARVEQLESSLQSAEKRPANEEASTDKRCRTSDGSKQVEKKGVAQSDEGSDDNSGDDSSDDDSHITTPAGHRVPLT